MIEIIISENDDNDGRPLIWVHNWCIYMLMKQHDMEKFSEILYELFSGEFWLSRGLILVKRIMKQLDMGPAAFVWDPYLILTNMTFDPDPWYTRYPMKASLGGQTGRDRDRRRCIRAHHAWAQVGSKTVLESAHVLAPPNSTLKVKSLQYSMS